MIKLTEQQVAVFGRPNFTCAQIAKLLIAAGEYENGPEKAEYEQAVYIHWASNLLSTHGEDWKSVGNKKLGELIDKLKMDDDND